MTDYRAVMDQVLKGWSVRQICSSSRCSHTTVQKARDALVEHNITTREQLRGVVCGFGVVGTASPRSWYRCSTYPVLQGVFFHS